MVDVVIFDNRREQLLDGQDIVNNLLSFGLLLITTNGFWAGLAILSAVISFLKIKTVVPRPQLDSSVSSQVPPPGDDHGTNSTHEHRQASSVDDLPTTMSKALEKHVHPMVSRCSLSSPNNIICAIEDFHNDMVVNKNGSPRKVTIIYDGDDDNNDCDDAGCIDIDGSTIGTTMDGFDDNVVEHETCRVFTSKMMLTIRKQQPQQVHGDLVKWHHYQDLRVLNGNVVKLWDGAGRRRLRKSATFPQSDQLRRNVNFVTAHML